MKKYLNFVLLKFHDCSLAVTFFLIRKLTIILFIKETIYCIYRAGQNRMPFMFASHHTSWLFKIIRLSEERSGSTSFSMR